MKRFKLYSSFEGTGFAAKTRSLECFEMFLAKV